MTRARDIRAGDWVKIGGRKVRVTKAEARGDTSLISWARGSASGMAVRDGKSDVKRIYGKGWKW